MRFLVWLTIGTHGIVKSVIFLPASRSSFSSTYPDLLTDLLFFLFTHLSSSHEATEPNTRSLLLSLDKLVWLDNHEWHQIGTQGRHQGMSFPLRILLAHQKCSDITCDEPNLLYDNTSIDTDHPIFYLGSSLEKKVNVVFRVYVTFLRSFKCVDRFLRRAIRRKRIYLQLFQLTKCLVFIRPVVSHCLLLLLPGSLNGVQRI